MLSLKICFAFVYDLFLMLAIWFVTAIPFVLWQGAGFEQNPVKLLAFQTYLLAISYVYLTYFWTLNGQSPGLRVWHLQLITTDNYLLSRSQANLRFLTGVLLFTIGWIGLFIPPVKQTLQDRISKTKIVPISKRDTH